MTIDNHINRRLAIVTGAVAATFVALAMAAAVSSGPASAAGSPADIPVKVFAQLPQSTNVRLSPDGQFFAMITPYNGVRHLLIQRLDKSTGPIAVPPFKNLELNWFEWANDERLVVSFKFEAERNGVATIETRLMAVNRDGSNFIHIVKPNKYKSTASSIKTRGYQAQIQDDIIDYLPNDPDHILLSIDADLDGEREVRLIDINNGNYKKVPAHFRGVQKWYSDQNGKVRFAAGYEGEDRFYMYRSPDTDKWTNYSKSAAYKNGYMLIHFAENPRQAYMRGLTDSLTLGVVKYDISGDKVIEDVFDDAEFSFGGIMVDRYSGAALGVTYIGDRPRLFYFDEKNQKRQRVLDKALKGTVNRIVSSTLDGNLHVVLATSDVDPGVFYLFDQKHKKLSFFAVHYSDIEPDMMSPMKAVSYKARDDLDIPAYLTVPKGREATNLPVVVLPHGGPHARDYIRFDYLAQFLASRGYAVFQPNFRGSSGYRVMFRLAGRQNWGLSMQDDLTDGVKWLIDQGIADPKRICIVGGSYGGYAAMMGAAKTPDLYRCAASINGVADLKGLIYSDKKYIGGSSWTKSIGELGEDSEQLRDTSPLMQSDKIRIPMLLIHAKDDRRVPANQSIAMAAKLKKAGVPYRFVELENGGHTMDTAQARLTMLQALEAFLAKYL